MTTPQISQLVGGDVPSQLSAYITGQQPVEAFDPSTITALPPSITGLSPITISSQQYDANTNSGYLSGSVVAYLVSASASTEGKALVVVAEYEGTTYMLGWLPLTSSDLTMSPGPYVRLSFDLSAFDYIPGT